MYLLTWLLAGSVGIASAASSDPPSAAQPADAPSASNAQAAAADAAAPLRSDQLDSAVPEDPESTQPESPVAGSANEDSAGPEAPQRRPGVVELEVLGVDGELEAAVLAGLDLARYGTRRTISTARLSRLLRETPDAVRAALEPFGYYRAQAEVINTPLPDRRYRVEVAVVLGEPVRVTELTLRVDGAAANDAQVTAAIAQFQPALGAVFDHRVYETGKASLDRALAGLGYFDRRFLVRRVEVTRAQNSAAVELIIESGERYRFGATRIEGAQFDDVFVERFIAWRAGVPYNRDDIQSTQNLLAASGYFGSLEIEPALDLRKDGIVPMTVTLVPAARSAWKLGAFVESTYGFGVRVGLDRRWINRAGHIARADLEFSQARITGTVEYRIPQRSDARAQWVSGVTLRDETTDVFDARSALASLAHATTDQTFSRVISLNWLRSQFVVGARPANAPRTTVTAIYPELRLSRVFAQDRIRPQRGGAVALTLRSAETALGSDITLRQARIEARYVLPAGEGARLLSRLELGWTSTGNFSRAPPELRFFAGGQNSVRGYDWQGLGPIGADGRPFGGPRVITASIEYERRFRESLSWATFVDAGNVFFGRDFEPQVGVGAGLRWSSPIGPIRLDLARGLDRELGGWRIYVSAGPDL